MAENYVGYFIDRCRERRNFSPPRQFIGALTKQIETAQKEKTAPEIVYEALDRMIETGSPPRHLPELIFACGCVPAAEKRDKRLLKDFYDQHGWPTGARFVLGTHSGHCVYDPLGFDRPPQDWPYTRPGREDVLPMLRVLDTIGCFLRSYAECESPAPNAAGSSRSLRSAA